MCLEPCKRLRGDVLLPYILQAPLKDAPGRLWRSRPECSSTCPLRRPQKRENLTAEMEQGLSSTEKTAEVNATIVIVEQ